MTKPLSKFILSFMLTALLVSGVAVAAGTLDPQTPPGGDVLSAPLVIECPATVITVAPQTPTNGFAAKSFGLNYPVASIGSTSSGRYLYCVDPNFKVWFARSEPVGYSCVASQNSFTCTKK